MIPAQTRSGLGSKIRAMFSRGEQGVLFNPNDMSTLFEDAAGTKPAVLEGLVGLMLDQSKGLVLGPELVTNGTFDSNVNGWAPWPSVTASRDTSIFPSGALKIQVTSGNLTYVEQSLGSNFIVGRKYKATATVYTPSSTPSNAGAAISFVNASFTGATSVAQSQKDIAQTLTIYFTATSTTHSIYLAICTLDFMSWGSVGSVAYFDNISVRELPGNHATSSSTARPTLTRRVNLLSNTEALTAAAWTKTAGVVVTDNAALAPNGTMTASTIALGAFGREIAQSFSATTATTTPTFYVKGTAGQVLNFGAAGVDRSITLTGGWDIATSTLPSGVTKFYIGNYSGGANALNISIWHPDLRPTNIGVNLPAYQRVGDTSVNAADYDTTGFPAWLRCSGGQSMVTPSINFGTDKMTVWAGVRKLSDAAVAPLVTLSTGSPSISGGFGLDVPGGAGLPIYSIGYQGSTFAYVNVSTFTAPITNVVQLSLDIAQTGVANEAKFRINQTSPTIYSTSGTDAGTGNFGNYPLYLFARNQASLFFNGLAGPIIVRGAQSSAAEISNAENWINAQQKVY